MRDERRSQAALVGHFSKSEKWRNPSYCPWGFTDVGHPPIDRETQGVAVTAMDVVIFVPV
jgi:hypothetical protein